MANDLGRAAEKLRRWPVGGIAKSAGSIFSLDFGDVQRREDGEERADVCLFVQMAEWTIVSDSARISSTSSAEDQVAALEGLIGKRVEDVKMADTPVGEMSVHFIGGTLLEIHAPAGRSEIWEDLWWCIIDSDGSSVGFSAGEFSVEPALK